MKIDNLIKELYDIKKSFGNIECCVFDCELQEYVDINEIAVISDDYFLAENKCQKDVEFVLLY